MTGYIYPSLFLVPSRSVNLIESDRNIVFITSIEGSKNYQDIFMGFLSHSHNLKLVSFVGKHSDEMHDYFDEIVIENNRLGILTIFNKSDYVCSIKEALDASLGYNANTYLVAISDREEREFEMLSEMAMALAEIQRLQ
jgi:hypothetical protein